MGASLSLPCSIAPIFSTRVMPRDGLLVVYYMNIAVSVVLSHHLISVTIIEIQELSESSGLVLLQSHRIAFVV